MLRRTSLRLLFRRLLVLLVVATPFVLPALTLAASQEDEALYEARFEGFDKAVKLADPGSNAGAWILFVLLTVLAIGVMFKNANRSHLD